MTAPAQTSTLSSIGVAMFTVSDQDAAKAFYVDVLGEHERLTAIGGIDLDPRPMTVPGAPLMFMVRDPDGNTVVVVEAPPAA